MDDWVIHYSGDVSVKYNPWYPEQILAELDRTLELYPDGNIYANTREVVDLDYVRGLAWIDYHDHPITKYFSYADDFAWAICEMEEM